MIIRMINRIAGVELRLPDEKLVDVEPSGFMKPASISKAAGDATVLWMEGIEATVL